MPILNINQYVEREKEGLQECPRCRGIMRQSHISIGDALNVIFKARKIKGRMKCPDCNCEVSV